MGLSMLNVSANNVHQASMMRLVPSSNLHHDAQVIIISQEICKVFLQQYHDLKGFLEQTSTCRIALVCTECRALSLTSKSKATEDV